MRKTILFLFATLLAGSAMTATAQTAKDDAKMGERLKQYFAKYKPKGTRLTQSPRMLDYQIDKQERTLTITADEFFAAQEFTPEITEHIYKKISNELPKAFNKYKVVVVTNTHTEPSVTECRQVEALGRHRLRG